MRSSSRIIARGLLPIALIVSMFLIPVTAFAQVQAPVADFYADASEADKAAFAASDQFVAGGKWLSAWKSLSDYDKENSNPFVLAKKISLALDGYAQNSLHLVFGFVDLAEGQDLEVLRMEGSEEIEPIEFAPGELAKSIESKGEAIPPVLSMLLGDYFHTVWTNYQGQWVEEDGAVLASGAEQYERAFAYETYTPASLGRQSEILVALERFDGAEKVILKGLELDAGNRALTGRLVETYLATERFKEVLPLAEKLLASASDDQELNEGYVAGIKAGLALEDKEILEKYISGYEKAFPTEYMPGLVRHLVAVRLKDKAGADAAADAVTANFPGNPDVIRSLLSTWLSEEDSASGYAYLDRTIALGGSDDALAALYFYKALLGSETAQTKEDIGAALANLAKAEEYFAKSYPADHEVFGMIKQLKEEWNAMLTGEGTSAAPAGEATAADATSAATGEAGAEATATPAETTATATPASPATPAEATAADATSAATGEATEEAAGEADATTAATE